MSKPSKHTSLYRCHYIATRSHNILFSTWSVRSTFLLTYRYHEIPLRIVIFTALVHKLYIINVDSNLQAHHCTRRLAGCVLFEVTALLDTVTNQVVLRIASIKYLEEGCEVKRVLCDFIFILVSAL